MDRDEILSWVKAERLGLADLLDELEDHEWATASLCPKWTMHDLAAHLTLSTRTTIGVVLKGAIKARGNWDRMEADLALERAASFTPAELIAQLRETAGSPRRAPLAAPLDPLVDALAHGQDIARPLGRTREMPVERVIAALDHVLASPFYGARKRLRDTKLVATDVTWSAGKGQHEIRGPVGELFLLATGRPTALPSLSGPGVTHVTTAL
ncbi:maleylpyruvate isomerase family mycothiol-dependent enzyme [Amycolatopsis nigrescens]|uniref:maleylpyruvate isomerase family mycothiol-dependent enzyme n=1 Tax=Amycolatopsis nigrescens TaxID=381445 RepID=UPI00038064D0|nr:maleylpyruvate isomerase family mycothiol-dependent enzyme [Amycolatopsis nigrescens]